MVIRHAAASAPGTPATAPLRLPRTPLPQSLLTSKPLLALVLWLLLALPGSSPLAAGQLQILGEAAMITADGTPATVGLPYYWDRSRPGQSGGARFLLRFPDLPGRQGMAALYIERAANSYEVRLNGSRLANAGSLSAPAPYAGQQPLLIPVPADLLRPENELLVTIAASASSRGGLSRVEFGAPALVEAHYQRALWFKVIGPVVIAAASMLLACLAGLVWWRQRDPLFGLYAIAELGWSFGLAEYFVADDAGAPDVWLALVLAGRAVFMYATARFAILVTGLEALWLRRGMLLYLSVKLPLIALMVAAHSTHAMVLANVVVNVAMALSIVAVLVRAAVTRPERERTAIAAALGLTLLISVLDLIHVWWIGDDYWDSSVTRYVSLIFSLTMGWLLVDRYTRATHMLAALNQKLDSAVSRKEQELHALYLHSREMEREQATLQERGRIMRDIHDGLGSQLVGMLAMLRSGGPSMHTLQQQLQHALDALKLSVDALQDTGGNLATVLGNLRYRLGPRLEAAGLRVDWQVARLPALHDLTPQRVRELHYLLLEVFSNAMQHAGGSAIRVSARHDAAQQALVIEIHDNGRGFTPEAAAHGRGLGNMRRRAEAIGAALDLRSSAQGTTVRLTFALAPQPPGSAV
ncbi:sensor histidine kinase [Cupriavidus basilensis]|uniref:sensor histidine kinase n=1 Tax=Cupriavidus basilensis TaxID=68895 RepID=UPI0028425B9A|nr:ATP-binding protein [Cupriavidus basilensis]MDR3380144.1 ATP-binding protein [Cupriavidus basilensis]